MAGRNQRAQRNGRGWIEGNRPRRIVSGDRGTELNQRNGDERDRCRNQSGEEDEGQANDGGRSAQRGHSARV